MTKYETRLDKSVRPEKCDHPSEALTPWTEQHPISVIGPDGTYHKRTQYSWDSKTWECQQCGSVVVRGIEP